MPNYTKPPVKRGRKKKITKAAAKKLTEMGRPLESIPEEWMYTAMIEIAKSGGGYAKMCSEFKIGRDKFYRWLKLYPAFSEAYEQARLTKQCLLEDLALRIAATGKGNAAMTTFLLSNNCYEDYGRSSSGNNVTVGNINVLQTEKTYEQLVEDVKYKLENLSNLPIPIPNLPEIIDVFDAENPD